jgi:hypothetical protein
VVDSFDGWYDGGEHSAPKVLGAAAKPQCVRKAKPMEAQTYGATIRMAKAQLSGRAQMYVVKCKAHVMDDASDMQFANMTDEEKSIARGNDLADHHAKAAINLFDPIGPALLGRLDRDVLHARAAVSVIARLIPLWPIAKEKKKRATETPEAGQLVFGGPENNVSADLCQMVADQPDTTFNGEERVPMEELHCWINGPNGWFCNVCRARTGKVMPRSRTRQRCPGLPDLLSAAAAASTGHVIAEVRHVDGDFSICRECGKWGTRSAKGLREHCERRPKTRGMMQSWRRVFKLGKHPDPRKCRVSHADGIKQVSDLVPFGKLRGAFVRQKRNRRITGKTKPWVGALLGVSVPVEITANAAEDHADDDDAFLECEDHFMGDSDDDGAAYDDAWDYSWKDPEPKVLGTGPCNTSSGAPLVTVGGSSCSSSRSSGSRSEDVLSVRDAGSPNAVQDGAPCSDDVPTHNDKRRRISGTAAASATMPCPCVAIPDLLSSGMHTAGNSQSTGGVSTPALPCPSGPTARPSMTQRLKDNWNRRRNLRLNASDLSAAGTNNGGGDPLMRQQNIPASDAARCDDM